MFRCVPDGTRESLHVTGRVTQFGIEWRDKVLGGPTGIAHDAGETARERLVHHETPGFRLARQHQHVGSHVGPGDLGLIQEAHEACRRRNGIHGRRRHVTRRAEKDPGIRLEGGCLAPGAHEEFVVGPPGVHGLQQAQGGYHVAGPLDRIELAGEKDTEGTLRDPPGAPDLLTSGSIRVGLSPEPVVVHRVRRANERAFRCAVGPEQPARGLADVEKPIDPAKQPPDKNALREVPRKRVLPDVIAVTCNPDGNPLTMSQPHRLPACTYVPAGDEERPVLSAP